MKSPLAFLPLLLLAGAPPSSSAPPPEERIVNGAPAKLGDAPWQAEIVLLRPSLTDKRPLYQARHLCGGAFIAPNWVITAQHCVDGDGAPEFTAANYEIRGGALNIDDDGGRNPRLARFEIVRLVRHDGYVFGSGQKAPRNDIALIEVRPLPGNPANLSAPIMPIPLAAPGGPPRLFDDSPVSVSGWGFTRGAQFKAEEKRALASIPADLLVVQLRLMPAADCTRKLGMGDSVINPATNLCAASAGDVQAGKRGDTCDGDSGGPLVFVQPGKPRYLVGLVSWGITSCNGENPGVYVKVSAYGLWVRSVIGGVA